MQYLGDAAGCCWAVGLLKTRGNTGTVQVPGAPFHPLGSPPPKRLWSFKAERQEASKETALSLRATWEKPREIQNQRIS